MCFLARYAIGAALSAAHRSPCEPHKGLTGGWMGGAWLSLARRGASAPGVNPALQMRSLALSTVGEFEKERTRLGPKSDFFLAWEIGCVAWERVKTCKSVCHTAKPWELAALSLLLEGIMGAFFAPLLVISGAKLYFLGAVLPFALVYFRRCSDLSLCNKKSSTKGKMSVNQDKAK